MASSNRKDDIQITHLLHSPLFQQIKSLFTMTKEHLRGTMKKTIMSLLIAGGIMFSLLSLISLEVGPSLIKYYFMVCRSHPSLWILQPVPSFILQVIVMPKMWVLQASVYVFLLLGNSFVVSFNTQSSVMKWNEMMALKNSHHFKEITDQDEMLLIGCI